jgi:hypothetical protein
MAGITGLGTTFNLPNYVGELFALTPEDTPLLSSIGGLTGGKAVNATSWSWETYDQRDPGNRQRTEGMAAPTAEERVRASVSNVVEIHQEQVSVSYTKQAANAQLATPGSAPFQINGDQSNAVMRELDWQVQRALKAIALDVNWCFINGTFVQPTTNGSARQTRGLLSAIATNRIAATGSTSVAATSATNIVTAAASGVTSGDKIVFTSTGAATNIVAGRIYYVTTIDTNTFNVSASSGGAALTLGSATLAFTKLSTATLALGDINSLLQKAYDNGGISEQSTATLLCNSAQKMALTRAAMTAYGQYHETSRTVGGVNVTTLVTDFGTLNVMMDRHMPQDTIAAVSLDQLSPVFLEVPGKGHFFEEPLARTGASDNVQLYGEIGLEYGNERAHAVMTGIKI